MYTVHTQFFLNVRNISGKDEIIGLSKSVTKIMLVPVVRPKTVNYYNLVFLKTSKIWHEEKSEDITR